MIQSMQELLGEFDVPAAQIRSEVFQAPVAIGAKPSPAEPAPAPASEPADEPAASTSMPRLTLVKSNRTVEVAPEQTLLEAAEQAGASIPCMCRAGVCGACRTRLVSGDAQCTSDALGADDRAAGFVLPCVTWAQGDCELEA
jgi:ferredoxin